MHANVKRGCYFIHEIYAFLGFFLYSDSFSLLQIVFNACVAGLNNRSVFHHCVVIVSGPLGSWIVCVLGGSNAYALAVDDGAASSITTDK